MIVDGDAMAALVGREVCVVLDRSDPDATLTGVLKSVAADGEVVVEVAGVERYGWPALGMYALDEEER